MDQNQSGSGGGRVVKLLACRASGHGFDSQSCHLNFRDWVSPTSKLKYDWKIVKSFVNPQNNPTPTKINLSEYNVPLYGLSRWYCVDALNTNIENNVNKSASSKQWFGNCFLIYLYLYTILSKWLLRKITPKGEPYFTMNVQYILCTDDFIFTAGVLVKFKNV